MAWTLEHSSAGAAQRAEGGQRQSVHLSGHHGRSEGHGRLRPAGGL